MDKITKKKAVENYKLSVTIGKTFLMGSLELYKIRFIETADNKYLKAMNDLHDTYKMVCNMDHEIKRLSKECRRLTKENKELKK